MLVAKYEVRVEGRRVDVATDRKAAARKMAEYRAKDFSNVSVNRIDRRIK